MTIEATRGDIAQTDDAAVVVNLFEGVAAPAGATGAVDRALGGAISDLIAEGDITGKRGENTLIYTLGRIPAKRVVVAGLGKAEDFDADAAREVHAGVARTLASKNVSGYSTILHGAGIGGLDAGAMAQAAAEGVELGLYSFDKYKASAKETSIERVSVVEFDGSKLGAVGEGIRRGRTLADAVNLARDMGNEPANHMTPTRMAEIALEVANEGGMSLTVFERADAERMGMGAYVGVAQGTEEPPKFIVIKYEGDPGNPGNNLGLLGKGITFDSGGLDIKSAAGMLTMKSDMSGGACVIGAMKAIGAFRPRLNVWGIVPGDGEYARTPRAASRRRGAGYERQDDRDRQYGRRGSAGSRRRALLRGGERADAGGGRSHADGRGPRGAGQPSDGRVRQRSGMDGYGGSGGQRGRGDNVAASDVRVVLRRVQERHSGHQEHRRRGRGRDNRRADNRRVRRRREVGASGHRRHNAGHGDEGHQPQGFDRRAGANAGGVGDDAVKKIARAIFEEIGVRR